MNESRSDDDAGQDDDPSGLSPQQIAAKLDQLWPENVRLAAQSNLPIGQRVAHFNIRSLLGHGAFGVVYLADDTIEDRPVALKLPRVEVLCNPEKRKRFSAEAEMAKQFAHPGIVEVYQCETEGPTPYIASAWCDGGDLGKWKAQQMARGEYLPPWEHVVELLAEVADAVHYAHQQGVTHRDLKPANILLCRRLDESSDERQGLASFRPKVTDFGLAKFNDPSIGDACSSLLVGTPIYMAPEQFNRSSDKLVDPALADIYSLGAILFETLSGTSPIQGETYLEVLSSIQNDSTLRLSQVRKDLPAALSVICDNCLHKNPEARYESAARLAEDLRLCLAGEPVSKKTIHAVARGRFWFRRKDWYSVAGWFAIGSQSLVTTWLVLSDFFKVVFGVLTMQEYLAILPYLILIAATTSLTMILFGVFTIKRKRWAVWGGVVLSAFNLCAPLSAFFSQPVIFDEVYNANDPYFSFKIHLILLLCFLSQLILFLCAACPAKPTRNKAGVKLS